MTAAGSDAAGRGVRTPPNRPLDRWLSSPGSKGREGLQAVSTKPSNPTPSCSSTSRRRTQAPESRARLPAAWPRLQPFPTSDVHGCDRVDHLRSPACLVDPPRARIACVPARTYRAVHLHLSRVTAVTVLGAVEAWFHSMRSSH